MKHPLTILITLCLGSAPLLAQENPCGRLNEAFALQRNGQFEAAIKTVRELTDSGQLTGLELGRAYVLLGAAYKEEGKFAAAQNAFEHSLRILKPDREHAADYASALENYAGLYDDAGQLDVATLMWLKALTLRQQVRDHTGAMLSLTNLAGAAIAQRQLHEASDLLKKASDEIQLARNATDDDFVLLFETQAWLSLAKGNASDAVAGYQRALELCTRIRGERHWLTGWEHLLRGRAYAQAGDIQKALADMREGLAIIEDAVGRTSPKYFLAEMAYSQVLDRSGSYKEAARVRSSAEQSRKDFYAGQCAGCTITVAGFQ